jgi:ubiquinone/menaquinone biosynthesis C-methylase UbiE
MTTTPLCNYEGSDYQQKFWENANRAYEDAAEELALRRLLPKAGQRLLELGAGAGRNTPRYAGYRHITLLDYSTTQLKQAMRKLGNGGRYLYIAADVYHLPFASGCFDAATMIRTLHHLAEPQLALRQANQCLSRQAVFILEFANKRNLKALMRYFLKKQSWNPFSREAVEFVELNFNFHPSSVKEMLVACGFKIERQLSVSYLRSDFLKRRLPLSLMTALESILQRFISWSAYSPSLFLKTRVVGNRPQLLDALTFRCPACRHSPLPDTPPLLACPACGRCYPVADGIYDFRLDGSQNAEV